MRQTREPLKHRTRDCSARGAARPAFRTAAIRLRQPGRPRWSAVAGRARPSPGTTARSARDAQRRSCLERLREPCLPKGAPRGRPTSAPTSPIAGSRAPAPLPARRATEEFPVLVRSIRPAEPRRRPSGCRGSRRVALHPFPSGAGKSRAVDASAGGILFGTFVISLREPRGRPLVRCPTPLPERRLAVFLDASAMRESRDRCMQDCVLPLLTGVGNAGT